MSQERPDPIDPNEDPSNPKRIASDPYAFIRARLAGEEVEAPDTDHDQVLLQSVVYMSEEDATEYIAAYDRAKAESQQPPTLHNQHINLAESADVSRFLARIPSGGDHAHLHPGEDVDENDWATQSMIQRDKRWAAQAAAAAEAAAEAEANNLPPSVDVEAPQPSMKTRIASLSNILAPRPSSVQQTLTVSNPTLPAPVTVPTNTSSDPQVTSSAPTGPTPPPAPAFDPNLARALAKAATPPLASAPVTKNGVQAKDSATATHPAAPSQPAQPDLITELRNKLKTNSTSQPAVLPNPTPPGPTTTVNVPSLRKTPGTVPPAKESTTAAPPWSVALRPITSPRTSQTLTAEESIAPVAASVPVKADFAIPQPPLKKNSQAKAPQAKNSTAPGNDLRKSGGPIKSAPPKVAPTSISRPLPPLAPPAPPFTEPVAAAVPASQVNNLTTPQLPKTPEEELRELKASCNAREQQFRKILQKQLALKSALEQENARLREELELTQSRLQAASEANRAIRGVNERLGLENDRLFKLTSGRIATQASRSRSSSNAAHTPAPSVFFAAAPERPTLPPSQLPPASNQFRWSSIPLIPNWKTLFSTQLALINIYKNAGQSVRECIISSFKTCPDQSGFLNKHAQLLIPQLEKISQNPLQDFYEMLTSYQDGQNDKTFEDLRQTCIHTIVEIEQIKEKAVHQPLGIPAPK